MLHAPKNSIKLIDKDNKELFLFNKVPDVDKYLEEHEQYKNLLIEQEVQVHMLEDNVFRNTSLLNRLPNLAYLHDTAVITSLGSIVSKMSSRGRCHEEIVVREALENLNIPTLYETPEGGDFEGCLLLSPSTIFVADTERHNKKSINRFINFILYYFDEIIYAEIPQESRFMHPDMVLNRMTENIMVYYPPAFLKTYHITKESSKEINIKEFMKNKNIDLIALTDKEQNNWGTSFVPIKSGIIINYDISLEEKTISHLEKMGIKFIHFHPDALLAGSGSLRCLTLSILRN